MSTISRWQQYESDAAKATAGWTLEVLVAPNVLYGSNGIRIAPDGTLWITQVNGDQITAWDPDADDLRIADPMGSPMIGPDDVAFDSAGTSFVTETLNNQVSARRGDDYFVLLDETVGPNGITVDPATDRLFVDEMAEGGRVLELDRGRRNSARVIAGDLDWLNALERGPDGRLYLPQVFAGTVIAVHPDDGTVSPVAANLAIPVAVKFAPDGTLMVAEAGAGQITGIDLTSGARRTICAPGPSIDNFCFDAAGALYTSNFVEARVERWDPRTGTRTGVPAPGGLIGPASIGRWDDDSLLVADHNSLIRVGADGALNRVTRLLGGQQFVADAAARVAGDLIALTTAGEVLVVDPATFATRKLVETAGSMTDQLLGLSSGGATALGATDRSVLVGLAGDIVEMAPDGSARSQHALGLPQVDGIAAADDVLAACCTDTGAVVVRRAGETTAHRGFAGPEAVAVLDDAVFVAETKARRLTRVGFDGRRDVVATELPIGMPRPSVRLGRSTSLFAADPVTLLIGCDGDGSVRRLARIA